MTTYTEIDLPHDVDKPMFTLFGKEYDSTIIECPKCKQLVGYDAFVFKDRCFYHIPCYLKDNI